MATKKVKKVGSKRFDAAFKTVDRARLYSVDEALEKAVAGATAKFDETIDVALNLNLQARHSIRDTIALPHPFGKEKRVLVFAVGEKADEAKKAGADYVGYEDLIEKIKGGFVDFDIAIAAPDLMKEVGKLGPILGRRGLMPNPKTGTVTSDMAGAVKSFKAGRVEYRAEKNGIIHIAIGKKSMPAQKLKENFMAFYEEALRKRPSDIKGDYVKSLAISSTMGPGIKVDCKKIG